MSDRRKKNGAKRKYKKWFAQKWVDIGSKKKDGSFSKCGRSKQNVKTQNVNIQNVIHGLQKQDVMTIRNILRRYMKVLKRAVAQKVVVVHQMKC